MEFKCKKQINHINYNETIEYDFDLSEKIDDLKVILKSIEKDNDKNDIEFVYANLCILGTQIDELTKIIKYEVDNMSYDDKMRCISNRNNPIKNQIK